MKNTKPTAPTELTNSAWPIQSKYISYSPFSTVRARNMPSNKPIKRSAFVPQCAQNPKQNEFAHRWRRALSPYTSLHRPAVVARTVLSASPPCTPPCPTRRDLLWSCVFCPADTSPVCVSRTPGEGRIVATFRRSSLIGSPGSSAQTKVASTAHGNLGCPRDR